MWESMVIIDPLVKGIYYMYLLPVGQPGRTIQDREVSDRIKYIMSLYMVPLYSSVHSIRNVLIKELLRGANANKP